jgi:histidinol-phosphate aminotransferase
MSGTPAAGTSGIDERARLAAAAKRHGRNYGIIFDLDSTLVDVSQSYDLVDAMLVETHSGKPLSSQELNSLREEGGYNNDWLAIHELLKRRGVNLPYARICSEAMSLYVQIAPAAERLMIECKLLEVLRRTHPLFIVTGRSRAEYDPIWGERLDKYFEFVYCLGDVPRLREKPAPDYLLQVMADYRLSGAVYIGNAIDDMWAAREAGIDRIGLTSTHPAAILSSAGAHTVVDMTEHIFDVLGLKVDS